MESKLILETHKRRVRTERRKGYTDYNALNNRERTGVMEIARCIDGMSGTEICDTGRIDVEFHRLVITGNDNDTKV